MVEFFYELVLQQICPAGYNMFKVTNRNTRLRCEICHWRRSGVFIVNFEQVNAPQKNVYQMIIHNNDEKTIQIRKKFILYISDAVSI